MHALDAKFREALVPKSIYVVNPAKDERGLLLGHHIVNVVWHNGVLTERNRFVVETWGEYSHGARSVMRDRLNLRWRGDVVQKLNCQSRLDLIPRSLPEVLNSYVGLHRPVLDDRMDLDFTHVYICAQLALRACAHMYELVVSSALDGGSSSPQCARESGNDKSTESDKGVMVVVDKAKKPNAGKFNDVVGGAIILFGFVGYTTYLIVSASKEVKKESSKSEGA